MSGANPEVGELWPTWITAGCKHLDPRVIMMRIILSQAEGSKKSGKLTSKKASWKIGIGNFLTFLIQIRPSLSMLIPLSLDFKMVHDGLIIKYFMNFSCNLCTEFWPKPTCFLISFVVVFQNLLWATPSHNLNNAQPYCYAFEVPTRNVQL